MHVPGMLAGVNVVALEQAVAVPLCTRHLAELGASVTKIERPAAGDLAREYDTLLNGDSTYFVWLNRGKRSVALDLKSDEGVEVLNELLATADVLVTNFGPGVVERLLGGAPDERFTNLIYCAVTGYGPVGPYRDRKAFDLLIQGEAGVTLSTGTDARPAKPGVSLADLAGGTYALAAILAGLFERQTTGRGRRIDISIFDVVIEWMSPLLLRDRAGGHVPPPAGMHHATIVPYGPYATRDGQLINIAVQTSDAWRRLCEVIDPTLATDPSYATPEQRLRNRTMLEPLIEQWTRGLDAGELIELLEASDVPWGHVRTVHEAASHPQLLAEERWVTCALAGGKTTEALLGPFRFDGRPLPSGPVPALGEATTEVLTRLGYTPVQIQRLRDKGIIRTP